MPLPSIWGTPSSSSSRRGGKPDTARLPLYSLLTTSNSSLDEPSTSTGESANLGEVENGQLVHRRTADPGPRRAGTPPTPQGSSWWWSRGPVLPSKARFLADFTLGFADGLTVPFALTAGLSSLGRTDTVVYAGVAEICAGCISMGIGGYLAAKGDAAADGQRRRREGRADDDDVAEHGGVGAEAYRADAEEAEKARDSLAGVPVEMRDYLRPLELPAGLLEMVLEHVREQPQVCDSLPANALSEDEDDARSCSPLLVGASVSLGYLLGGVMPLFPYFIVERVGDGVFWSFGICLMALFGFGFTKDYVLSRQRREEDERCGQFEKRRGLGWRNVKRSAWEGLQMVLLGGVAALAAVLCVRFFEGLREDSSPASA